ncbi:MAG: phosphoesterase, partial [Acidianus infernus]|nr:phosphoesterase [Acidianus infernus]
GSKALILPAIGSYQAGNDISLIHNNYMSPLIRNYGILEEAKPYVIIEGEGIMEFPKLELLKNIVV